MPSILWIEEFPQAIRANRDVGRNQRADFLAILAVDDAEILIAIAW
jgi:hypothetical protein